MKKTRILLLVCICLLTAVVTRPAKSEDCVSVKVCRDCNVITPTPEKRLCTQVLCGGVAVSESCGACMIQCLL
ncbi:MAG TPA: hypothetical protein VF173_01400 [Thermoanaerobaculia bacterium]|nr:hypothetical protein [Thermoanaerobaculia bacterium]